MSIELEEMIEAYLEGGLDEEQALAFELSLSDPQTSRAFSEAIMLRDLLTHLPPDQPPWELILKIESSVQDQIKTSKAMNTRDEKTPAFRNTAIRAVLRGTGWSLRGPAMVLCGMPKVDRRIRKAVSIRTIWGSAGRLARTLGQMGQKRKRPWWKRAIERVS